MNTARIFEYFDRISEADDAISRLRRFILGLAVLGKLVPQDPKDEPASELLKRMASKRTQLVKAGKTGRREQVPSRDDAAPPFSLPAGWEWVHLGELGQTQTGTTPPKGRVASYGNHIPFIKPGDMLPGGVIYSNEGLSKDGIAESGRIAAAGSLLMVCIGTIGKCQLIDRACSFNQQINALSPYSEIESRYLLVACQSEFVQKTAWAASARTTIAILNKGNWERLLLPLPPLAEQRRIVAKVDGLMALCHRLEAARAEREATRSRLTTASLARLNTPDPDPANFADHARFALDHITALTTGPGQVQQFRQTILNLAVRGTLVPQDPNDEPASELVKRIAAEKARWATDDRKERATAREAIQVSEGPFKLPRNWVWVPATSPACLISDKGKKIPTAGVLESGEFPVVDQGKVFIRGYCNDRSKVIHVDEAIVLFGDHTRETKLIDFDFVVGADGVKLLRPICLLPNFYYLALRWLPLDSRGYGRHFKLLRASHVPIPPLAEQRRIVAKVDELMVLCDRLEASLVRGEEKRGRLLEAVLHEALAPDLVEAA